MHPLTYSPESEGGDRNRLTVRDGGAPKQTAQAQTAGPIGL